MFLLRKITHFEVWTRYFFMESMLHQAASEQITIAPYYMLISEISIIFFFLIAGIGLNSKLNNLSLLALLTYQHDIHLNKQS